MEPTTLDRFMARRAPAMLALGLAGIGLLIWVALGAVGAPWQLSAESPTVMSSTAECSRRNGALYEIRVDGASYGGCAGATNPCAEVEAIPIAYDPEDPSQCRVASAVDGLGRYEATVMLLALGLSFVAIASLAFFLSQRVRGTEGAEARFVLLQRVSWAALALAVLTANGTAVYALL